MLVASTQGINRLEYLQICKQTRLPGTCTLKEETSYPFLQLLSLKERKKEMRVEIKIKVNEII